MCQNTSLSRNIVVRFCGLHMGRAEKTELMCALVGNLQTHIRTC